jgi:hypothetical protein
LLRKIWGFHGSDYEEFRFLWHKNLVRASQETHYVSATEPSRLMLCKIWGFHGGDYEECHVRFEVFTAVTMKNAVFSDIKIQLVPLRRHITPPLQIPTG